MDIEKRFELEHKTCNYLFDENERLNAIIDELKERYERLKQEHIDTITRNEEKQQRIDKAIEYIKENTDNTNFIEVPSKELLEILEDKEIEEIPLFEGTLEQLNNLSIIGDKENE